MYIFYRERWHLKIAAVRTNAKHRLLAFSDKSSVLQILRNRSIWMRWRLMISYRLIRYRRSVIKMRTSTLLFYSLIKYKKEQEWLQYLQKLNQFHVLNVWVSKIHGAVCQIWRVNVVILWIPASYQTIFAPKVRLKLKMTSAQPHRFTLRPLKNLNIPSVKTILKNVDPKR